MRKILCRDVLYQTRNTLKEVEAGRYRFPPSPESQPRVEVRAADLIMLLEGIDLSTVKRGKRYHRPVARAAI
jgi:transposase